VDGVAFVVVIGYFVDWYCECVDVVVGIEVRGFMFVVFLVVEFGVGFVLVCKVGKLSGEMYCISYDFEYGIVSVEVEVLDRFWLLLDIICVLLDVYVNILSASV